MESFEILKLLGKGAYGRALLKTAFEACGREAPAPDAPDTASSSPLAEANQSP